MLDVLGVYQKHDYGVKWYGNLRGKHSSLKVQIECRQSALVIVPRRNRDVWPTYIKELHFPIQTENTLSEPLDTIVILFKKTDLADTMWPFILGCHRAFWTHEVCSEYDRTTASSSSNLRSNTLTPPSPKPATKVCDEPL